MVPRLKRPQYSSHTNKWRTKCLYVCVFRFRMCEPLKKTFVLLCLFKTFYHKNETKAASSHRCVSEWVCICVRLYACIATKRGEWKRHSIHEAHSSFSVGVRLQANQVIVKCALCKLFLVWFQSNKLFKNKSLFNLFANRKKQNKNPIKMADVAVEQKWVKNK